LLGSFGVRRFVTDEEHAAFGLAPPELRITLHGRGVLETEDQDVLATFESGATVDTAAGAVSFARRLGETQPGVWEIAFDPRPELERGAGSGLRA